MVHFLDQGKGFSKFLGSDWPTSWVCHALPATPKPPACPNPLSTSPTINNALLMATSMGQSLRIFYLGVHAPICSANIQDTGSKSTVPWPKVENEGVADAPKQKVCAAGTFAGMAAAAGFGGEALGGRLCFSVTVLLLPLGGFAVPEFGTAAAP